MYRITLVPLANELRAAYPGLLSLFYADDAAFDGSEQLISQHLKLLTKRGAHRGYFPEPGKSLFISDTPGQEEAEKWEFAIEGLNLDCVSASRYLGAYLGLQDQLEVWVKPQVEAWAHRVIFLGKIAQRHPKLAYSGLGMLLQLEWQYLRMTVPGVGTLIGPNQGGPKREILPLAIWGGGVQYQLSENPRP